MKLRKERQWKRYRRQRKPGLGDVACEDANPQVRESHHESRAIPQTAHRKRPGGTSILSRR